MFSTMSSGQFHPRPLPVVEFISEKMLLLHRKSLQKVIFSCTIRRINPIRLSYQPQRMLKIDSQSSRKFVS